MDSKYKIINVPIKIPMPLFQAGAVEKYARLKGWTPKVQETNPETGEITEVDNPMTAEEWGIKAVQDVVRNEYKEIIVAQGAVQGREQAAQMFDSLFAE